MKRDHAASIEVARAEPPPDSGGEIRAFAAWMGLILVAFGVAVAAYMFWRIGNVLLDPRAFETQVDRWEFVVRGRATDALPVDYETPDRKRIAVPTDPSGGTADPEVASETPPDRNEQMAQLVGRLGSKSARPAALLLIVLILTLLVRIAIGIINAGIRLAYLTAGEKDYMKRIVDELVEQRRDRE